MTSTTYPLICLAIWKNWLTLLHNHAQLSYTPTTWLSIVSMCTGLRKDRRSLEDEPGYLLPSYPLSWCPHKRRSCLETQSCIPMWCFVSKLENLPRSNAVTVAEFPAEFLADKKCSCTFCHFLYTWYRSKSCYWGYLPLLCRTPSGWCSPSHSHAFRLYSSKYRLGQGQCPKPVVPSFFP